MAGFRSHHGMPAPLSINATEVGLSTVQTPEHTNTAGLLCRQSGVLIGQHLVGARLLAIVHGPRQESCDASRHDIPLRTRTKSPTRKGNGNPRVAQACTRASCTAASWQAYLLHHKTLKACVDIDDIKQVLATTCDCITNYNAGSPACRRPIPKNLAVPHATFSAWAP